MPHYSVATTKDQLSSLIDKALAGEEVVVTRHGKPVVRLDAVGDKSARTSLSARLREFRATLPPGTPYLELKRQEGDERQR